ncbi:hypothetical protein EPIR_3573 [Erwinia piriflorinigrans CFBP 5888]|uniref:Uncharacterized protein n=1 Tax=Erwinia piriflorinigrans CFBP 5888 TaxID=1161919 RepID=V5ZD70_9GAMM|nr:hypothetical protein EPIR_3573 [Erwinia piriflorinigrans CFBP 5888]
MPSCYGVGSVGLFIICSKIRDNALCFSQLAQNTAFIVNISLVSGH